MSSARIAAASGTPLTPLRTMADVSLLRTAASADERLTLILQLGGTNDAHGKVDAEVRARSKRTAELVAAKRKGSAGSGGGGNTVRVLTSGGAAPSRFPFNPTTTPHWQMVEGALAAAGVPEEALLRPGLPALHTVDEAIMARAYVRQLAVSRPPSSVFKEVIVVTSDFHVARARHLFKVAFSAKSRCPLPVHFEGVPSALGGSALKERRRHEAESLRTLRTRPNGVWLDFLRENELEVANWL